MFCLGLISFLEFPVVFSVLHLRFCFKYPATHGFFFHFVCFYSPLFVQLSLLFLQGFFFLPLVLAKCCLVSFFFLFQTFSLLFCLYTLPLGLFFRLLFYGEVSGSLLLFLCFLLLFSLFRSGTCLVGLLFGTGFVLQFLLIGILLGLLSSASVHLFFPS